MRRFARRAIDAGIAALGPSALVLTYHRVADLPTDPQLLAVTPQHFEAQAKLLSAEYDVVPLYDLVSDLKKGTLRDGTVALTFDDGYADNLANAAPTLSSQGLHATVFVSSGYLGVRSEFWWDELERVVLGSDTADGWDVLREPVTERQREYLELSASVRRLPQHEREAALDSIRTRFGADDIPRPSHLPMTAEQLNALDSTGSMEIGAHSRDHEVLASLDVAAQREVIGTDKEALERLLGHEVRLFSYPFGGRDDYSAETVECVREAGFAGACANHPGLVKSWTDPFRLPRFVARDWPAEELGRRLDAWFSGRTA